MGKEIEKVTDENANNLIMLENGCTVLEAFADAWLESTDRRDHIQIQNPHDETEIVDFGDSTTFPLAIEGLVQGAANQLIANGYKDVVMKVFKRHGMLTNLDEEDTDGEG